MLFGGISSINYRACYAIITDMEPKSPSPERIPDVSPDTGEFATPQPENWEQGERSPEQTVEQAGEQHHATTSTGAPVPIALPTPVQVAPADDTQAVASDSDMPLAAADEDLIEKEWVDKAKKIVAETKDDPHMQEKEVGKLQADYLRKRYGKQLGEAS